MKKRYPLTMNWKVNSQYGQEKVVANEVLRLLMLYSINKSRIEEILTAISEACLNAMEHGNKFEMHRLVEVAMEMHENGCIFRVYDEGTGFDDPYANTYHVANFVNIDPRGWGLHLMNTFANQLRVGNEGERFYIEMVFLTSNSNQGGCGHGTIISR